MPTSKKPGWACGHDCRDPECDGCKIVDHRLALPQVPRPPCKWVSGCPQPTKCKATGQCMGWDPHGPREVAGLGHNGGPPLEKPHEFGSCAGTATEVPAVSLPDDNAERLKFPMADGLLDYFPNALAEVAFLSHTATQQHHPEAGMHWDRSKSTDHRNKIMRHLVDTGKRDGKGMRHSAMVAWRALALLQEELEQDLGLPPSRASRNRPADFSTKKIG